MYAGSFVLSPSIVTLTIKVKTFSKSISAIVGFISLNLKEGKAALNTSKTHLRSFSNFS